MSFILYRPGRRVTALGLVLCLFTAMLSACVFSFDSYAEGVRMPDQAVSDQVTLKHTHSGNENSQGGCYTKAVYHKHDGNWRDGGDCYKNIRYHQHVDACNRTCTVTVVNSAEVDAVKSHCYEKSHDAWFSRYRITVQHCDECTQITGKTTESREYLGACQSCHYGTGLINAQMAAKQMDTFGGMSHTYKGCGYEEGEFECYTLSCTKSTTTVERYETECGLEEKEYGELKLENTTPEWTRGTVTLKGSFEGDAESVCGGAPGMSFYEEESLMDSDQDTVTVNHNGSYRVALNVNEDHFDAGQAYVTLEVRNIDNTAPAVDITCVDADLWSRDKEIIVSASDVQPDGTDGSGLADEPYSYDLGETWVSDNTLKAEDEGSVDVWVRDYCGNIFKTQINVDKIDKISPTASYSGDPVEWHEGEGARVFTIAAEDTGAGLHDTPYSYDGGVTWTADNTVSRSEAGTFTVLIRDALGNESTVEIKNDYTPGSARDDSEGDPAAPGEDSGSQSGGSPGSGTSGGDSSGSGTSGSGSDTAGSGTDNKEDSEAGKDKDSDKTKKKDGKNGSGSGVNGSSSGGSGSDDAVSSDASQQGGGSASSGSSADTSSAVSKGDTSDALKEEATKQKGKKNSGSVKNALYEDQSEDPEAADYTGNSTGGDGYAYDYPSLWNWYDTGTNGYSLTPDPVNTADDYTGLTFIGYDEASGESVELPYTSSDAGEITLDQKSTEDEEKVPFYRTKAFKVTASVSGGAFGIVIPVSVFLLMYLGVFVFSYDSAKYRFMGIRLIHRSERGRYIRLSRDFLDGSYSSRFKLEMGTIYMHMHKDELLHICAGDEWMSVPVQRNSYITIRQH